MVTISKISLDRYDVYTKEVIERWLTFHVKMS